MVNRKKSDDAKLKNLLITRVTDQKFAELQKILAGDPTKDMSQLLRDILHNKPIKVFTKDKTLDNTMEELSKLRSEIRAIGVNINQITRFFNTYPEPQRKLMFAKMAFKEYLAIEPKINEILEIMSKLSKRWLSG